MTDNNQANYVTREDVDNAIISLLLKGTNPSIDAIRLALGKEAGMREGQRKGSPNTVAKFKKEWTSEVAENRAIPLPAHIPEAALEVIYHFWGVVSSEATRSFELEKNKILKSEQAALELAGRATEAADRLRTQIDILNDRISERDKKISLLEEENKGLGVEVIDCEEHISALQEKLKTAQFEIAGLKREIEIKDELHNKSVSELQINKNTAEGIIEKYMQSLRENKEKSPSKKKG